MVQIPIPYRPEAGPAEPSPQSAPYGPADHAADQDAAKRADVALVAQANPLLDEPGADPGQVLQQLAHIHETAAQGLSPSGRVMFDQVAGPRLAGWRQDISAEAQRRQAQAAEATSEARQQMAAREFSRHALSDPQRASADLLTVSSEARARAERQGADPEAAARAGAQARGEAVAGAVKGALVQDPEAALRLFDSHRELIDPDSAGLLHPLILEETERQDRARRIDDLIAAARPSLPQGLGDILPPDAHPPLDPQAIAARAIEHAGDDPDRRRAMALDVQARVAALNARRASAIRAATAKGQDCLADPAIASLDDLPTALRLTLPQTTRQGMQVFYASGGHPPVSDPQAYAGLHALLLADPVAYNDLDLTPYAAHLDQADFARLRQDQQALRQGGLAARTIRDAIGQVTAKTAAALAEIGVTATTDPARLAQAAASALTAAQDARDAQDGKPLTEQQADQAVDKAVMGNDGYLVAANGLWLFPRRDTEVEQQALKTLAARSHEFGVFYDPAMRTLGRYTYNRDGSRTFTPMGEAEIQAFKERTLDSDSYRPGVTSPEELALDREIEEKDGPKLREAGTVGPHNYRPRPTDELTLARMIYAESSNIPEDYDAIGWSIINRIGDREFGATLDDVLNQKNAFQIVESGGGGHGGSSQWRATANPAALTGANAASWAKAREIAAGIINGAIPDPTEGATFFFSARDHDGSPESAPGDFPRMIRKGTIRPSTFNSRSTQSRRNYFYVETKKRK